MSWSGVLVALLVSHVVGDIVLQTDWQAVNKAAGWSTAVSRRALLSHLGVYMLAFVPTLAWIAVHSSAPRAVAVGALVAVPHLVIDDGRLVRFWLREVKRTAEPTVGLAIAVDQSFHLLCLLGAALVARA